MMDLVWKPSVKIVPRWGNYLILLFSLSFFGNSSRSLQTCSFPHHLQCSLWTAIKGSISEFWFIDIRIGDKVFRMACFFSEKNLVRPRGVKIPSPLDQISLTPNTKGFQLYFHPRAPPSWSKQAKRLIFGTLKESDEKDDLKVTGHREKFYIGFLSQNFLWESLYMWRSQEKILGRKSMKKFSGKTKAKKTQKREKIFFSGDAYSAKFC